MLISALDSTEIVHFILISAFFLSGLVFLYIFKKYKWCLGKLTKSELVGSVVPIGRLDRGELQTYIVALHAYNMAL